MNPNDVLQNKKFWLVWVKKYRSFEFLWDIHSEDYNNREKRKKAYAVLIRMAKNINPSADEMYIRSRISNLRSSFRREVKKVRTFREKGVWYESSWVFYKVMNSIYRLDTENLDRDSDVFEEEPGSTDLSENEDPFWTMEETNSNNTNVATSSKLSQKKRKKRINIERMKNPNDFDVNSSSSFEQKVSESPTVMQYTGRECPLSRTRDENNIQINPHLVPRNNKFWLVWIEKYRKFEFLWNTQSKEYKNIEKRKDAYAVLIRMAKKINPSADEMYVRSRISNLRSCYRREVRRVLAAREEGMWYESSWAFYKIMNSILRLDTENLDKDVDIFEDQPIEYSDPLDEEDPLRTSEGTKANINSNEQIYSNPNQDSLTNENSNDFYMNSLTSFEQVSDSPTETQNAERKCPSSRITIKNSSLTITKNDLTGEPATVEQTYSQPSKKKCGQDNCLRSNMDDQRMMYNITQNQEDEWDILGRRIANHFRNMIPIQRLFAERIISEVCIQGRVEQLTWDSGYVSSRSLGKSDSRLSKLSHNKPKKSKKNESDDVIDQHEY